MALSAIKSGALVSLKDLMKPSSEFFKDGASLRVTGKLVEYSVETAIAIIVDGNVNLKIDTQHLRELSIRIGSIYQFIGELLVQSDNEAILQARVGRNVDGIDLNLYHQSLQLLRQFQADHLNKRTN
ncbi:CST complex subunit TEN1 isoform X1 [Cucumis melo]|uniref:CST complex subunit TEN1 n=1 Tax=Cucumis melo TaxID=3656 RepID=A0A1S3BY71_CUCME|nr:CST complex subunit TEN1 isoform X1 [Cucumis melo]XP_008453921.1 CST complex subunit TEN1 isoform X1 [Cucumis melo]XP_050940633.1 CST complex subunit TEN1 isoform X1 [Cucumis melo]XP_050940634.1 CST complex subunit TEN1 isoform X1 [Cucumis melo]